MIAFRDRDFWRVVVSAKVLLALVVFSALSTQFNRHQFKDAYANWPPGGKPTLSSHFATWDGAHYLLLSKYGYVPGSSSCAFYPLWPAAISVATALTGGSPVLASLLLTNALSLIGFWLLYRLVERHYGPAVSRDSLILMLAFPAALFFSFPYTESLYLVILMLFFWGLELERWSWVAVAGFLLPLARPVWVFMVVPLAWYLYEQRRKPVAIGEPAPSRSTSASVSTPQSDSRVHRLNRSSRCESAPTTSDFRWSGLISTATKFMERPVGKLHWLLLLCPVLGYAAYFGIMYAGTGNALEGFEAQQAYPYSPSIKNMFNVAGFTNAFLNLRSLDGMMDSALDRGFFLLFLALLPAVWKLNRTWFWYALPTGLIPAMTSYFMSYRRYIMVLFPVFIVLALLLARSKSRWVFWYYVILMAALQAWAVKQFVNFNWAG